MGYVVAGACSLQGWRRPGAPSAGAAGAPPAAQPAGQLYSPRSLIIMYDGPRGKKSLLKAVKKYGARLMYDYTIINGVAIELPEGSDVHRARAWFQKVKGVVSVNYDRIYQLNSTAPGPQ